MDQRETRFVRRGARRAALVLAAALLLGLAEGGPARAGDHRRIEARSGIDIATAAAVSWAPDAILVYLENDEDLDEAGTAPRWGYLFFSPSLEKSRVYSVRDGAILAAEYLEIKFEAPPLASGWLDSGAALAIAERDAGREFRSRHQGTLSTMLLMRGAFHDGDPDRTTWTLVYTSPSAPALFVVVDALDGEVRRTWRG